MQNKLQEITDKIYREGLEKGQSEADKSHQMPKRKVIR